MAWAIAVEATHRTSATQPIAKWSGRKTSEILRWLDGAVQCHLTTLHLAAGFYILLYGQQEHAPVPPIHRPVGLLLVQHVEVEG